MNIAKGLNVRLNTQAYLFLNSQSLLNEYRRNRCKGDYKSWAYMTCVGLVVVAAIVLVIMAASGYLNIDSGS